MSFHRALVVAPLLFALACSDPGAGDGAFDNSDGSGEVASDPVVGTYELTTTYDLTQSEILPDLAGDVLGSLTGLQEDPAGTIVDLLQAANVPVVSTVLGLLPGILRDQVTNWINEYVFDHLYEGVPVTQEIAGWVDDIATGLTQFQVISQLELGTIDEAGNTIGRHRLSALRFQMHGASQTVDTPELIDQLTMAEDVSVNISFIGEQGTMDVGDHGFNLPIGDFAVVALNAALQSQLGVANLSEALGQVIDCQGLAHSVADKCVAFVCVGHETELTGLCEAGLSQVAHVVEDRLSSIGMASIHLAAGSAQVAASKSDDASVAKVSQFSAGQWQAGASLNGVELPIGATFVGARQ